MHWLACVYSNRIKFTLLCMGAMAFAGLTAAILGRYLAQIFGWDDDDVPMAACFFAALALEACVYDRYLRRRFFGADR